MRVHVVSDVHGRADALAQAGEGADALICLGDLLLFIDYADHSQGIFPGLFGAEKARELVELRTARRFDEAREMSARAVGGAGRRPPAAHRGRGRAGSTPSCSRRCRCPSYLTYGNVDLPAAVARPCPARAARPGRRAGRAGRLDVRLRRRRPADRLPDAQRDRRRGVRRQGRRPSARSTCCARTSRPPSPSCSMTPSPAGWSGGARRCWHVIEKTQPRYVLFGHVHQPLQSRITDRRTECINVGHFRATRQARTCCSGD